MHIPNDGHMQERGHFYPLSGHRSGPFYVALGTAQVTQAIYGTQHPFPILDPFSSFVLSWQMTELSSFSETEMGTRLYSQLAVSLTTSQRVCSIQAWGEYVRGP